MFILLDNNGKFFFRVYINRFLLVSFRQLRVMKVMLYFGVYVKLLVKSFYNVNFFIDLISVWCLVGEFILCYNVILFKYICLYFRKCLF